MDLFPAALLRMKAFNSSLKYFIVQKLNYSNKEAIGYIVSGRVLVNGKRGTLTQELFSEDEVRLDGQIIKASRKSVYIAYHKPCGIETTMNTSIEDNLPQAVNIPHDIFPVGRLDKASEGLMLLTNDGELTFQILQPKTYHHEKEYEVTVDGPLTQQALDQLAAGIVIMGRKTRPAILRQLNENTFNIVLTQGLNRQIRRMCYKLGYEVERLVRIRFLTLELGNLSSGEWRYLSQSEISDLLHTVSG